MLNFSQVLQYIKARLSLPNGCLEKTDAELQEYIINATIPDFSNYFPDVEWTSVLPSNINYTVPGKTYHYRFFDDEDLPIYGIKECYFSESDDYITGHPPLSSFSFESMKWWSLSVFKSRFFKPFSCWHKTYRFIPPNIVRVLPEADSNFVVEYEREQPHDLRKIPPAMKRIFMDLALADCGILIGSIRTQFTEITTQYGTIPLKGEDLKTEYQDLRRETIDKLAENSLPEVTIDIG